MDSIDNFKDKLSEIDILLGYAEKNIDSIAEYQLFNKVSIVLLSTKLEVFIEDFVEEHSLRMLEGHTNKTISDKLKELYFDTAIDLISGEKKRANKNLLFNSLMDLYHNDENTLLNVYRIRPSRKFSYGRHGQKEIEALFCKHGLGNFIKSEVAQECLAMMNSLVAIRNNVIHQDATPSLTHQTVSQHKENILRFVENIEADIEQNKAGYYNEMS